MTTKKKNKRFHKDAKLLCMIYNNKKTISKAIEAFLSVVRDGDYVMMAKDLAHPEETPPFERIKAPVFSPHNLLRGIELFELGEIQNCAAHVKAGGGKFICYNVNPLFTPSMDFMKVDNSLQIASHICKSNGLELLSYDRRLFEEVDKERLTRYIDAVVIERLDQNATKLWYGPIRTFGGVYIKSAVDVPVAQVAAIESLAKKEVLGIMPVYDYNSDEGISTLSEFLKWFHSKIRS